MATPKQPEEKKPVKDKKKADAPKESAPSEIYFAKTVIILQLGAKAVNFEKGEHIPLEEFKLNYDHKKIARMLKTGLIGKKEG